MKRAASPLDHISVMPSDRNLLDNQETRFLNLSSECIEGIFCFSSCKELLSIEQVNREMRVYTSYRWKQLCKEKNIPVDWSKLFGMKEENCPEKFTYRTEMALQSFFAERMRIIRHAKKDHYINPNLIVSCPVGGQCLREETAKVQSRFDCIGVWNSDLSTYINKDLQKLIKWGLPHEGYRTLKSWNIQISQSDIATPFYEIFLPFKAHINHLNPGQSFLDGLSYLTDYALQIDRLCADGDLEIDAVEVMRPLRFQLFCAFEFLRSSMEGGVVHTSLAIHEVIACFDSGDIEEAFFQLAQLSAERGDYRALEKLFLVTRANIRISFIKELVKEQKNYPPQWIYYALDLIIDADIIRDNENITKAQEFFQKGIERYQESKHPIPGQVWLIGVGLNIKSGKWENAKECLDDALADFGENIPFRAWKLKANIQCHFGDLEGESLSLQKILDACRPYENKEWVENQGWISNCGTADYELYCMGKIRESIPKRTIELINDRLNSIRDQLAHGRQTGFDPQYNLEDDLDENCSLM